ERRVFDLAAFVRVGRLQRLKTVEQQQRLFALHESSEAFAFVPRRTGGWVCVTKPQERGVDELIGRSDALARALTVERPRIDAPRAAIVVGRHPLQPLVDER